jgi:uncharacterized protein (DUF2236 family)
MPERAGPPPRERTGFGKTLTNPLRTKVAHVVTHLTSGGSSGGPSLDYASPPGDPGLFGPESVCWRVHADFTSMMVGGISALMLQSLHPLALAGVWDHSTFRTDMLGRLRRTAVFISGTTYGNRQDALALIERVKHIHLGVTGVAPDGRPYRADDPALLRWVHVAEVSSFLAAHLRYANPALEPAAQDRYYAETARIAQWLGATDVPSSVAEVAAYLAAMQPELEAGPRVQEVVNILRNAAPHKSLARPVAVLMFNAAVDLLPDWAQGLIGFSAYSRLRGTLSRSGVHAMAPVIRWALVNGVSKRARRRVTATPN